MSCPACTSTKIWPTCWYVGTVGDISPAKDVDIYIQNVTTGKIIKQQLDDATEIWIDLTDPSTDFFTPHFAYEIWVTERDDQTRLPVTLKDGVTVDTCYTLRFADMGEGQVGGTYTMPAPDLVLEVE